MQGIKVSLHPDFEFGSTDTRSFKDYPKLTPEEELSVVSFMNKVTNGDPLIGKNKPSWEYDSGDRIPNREYFEEHKFWHYHSGPSYPSHFTISKMTIALAKNVDGIPSPEVIHYRKLPDEIVITGYSPEHVPFPNPYNPMNPIGYRHK
ncbi:hypothetical protein [Vibrio navarrensis]|uniref:hypothetical protein n=1 Tax=Vibrio navarrensis TaxID=29495 RepID=UPI00186991BC|nr:hypothetical protein [Vibrio navarrensis]MBE4590642.1 hypothetical protein [Vibrio navarrensis]